jgi:sn-glycerol 3-phosphate transport system permease protein
LRLLWQIVIPMAKPVLITIMLILLVDRWNDYLWPLIVTNQDHMRTLPVGISYLFNPETITRWGPLMAATFFAMAPILIIYLWAQRHIIEGISAGATKG